MSRDVQLGDPDLRQRRLHDGDQVHVPSLGDLRQVVVVEGAIVGPPHASGSAPASDRSGRSGG